MFRPLRRRFAICVAILLLSLGGIVGGSLGYAQWGWSGQAMHFSERLGAIKSQAGQMPAGGILVIGDSITEYNRFTRLCGLPALNAGIAWARTPDWLPAAKAVVNRARPSKVIIALGTNDKFSATWQRQYRAVVAATGAALAIGTDDPQKDRYIASILPIVRRPPIARYGRHPDAAGAELWREGIERTCPRA